MTRSKVLPVHSDVTVWLVTKVFRYFIILETVSLAVAPLPSSVLSNKKYFSRDLVMFMSQLYRPATRNCAGGSAAGESSAEPGESAGGDLREGSRADVPSGPGWGKRGCPSPPPCRAASWKLGWNLARKKSSGWRQRSVAAAGGRERRRRARSERRRGAGQAGAGARVAGGAGSEGAQRPQRLGRVAVRAGARRSAASTGSLGRIRCGRAQEGRSRRRRVIRAGVTANFCLVCCVS